MADEPLYESATVWDQQLQVGQRNLIRAICDFWPESVRTVLDVGCGDGKITHALAGLTQAAFHGFDGSREALSRLHLPSTHGDVSALPFVEQAFDLVLTTDVFEHLPDQVEQAAWLELFRVARDWVFVAVPFREELLDGTTVCVNCGKQYHVNWHHRTYDVANLSTRTPTGWTLAGTVISGEPWSPMLPPETFFRRLEMNEWSGWTESVCPACGAPGHFPDAMAPFSADVARALGRHIYEVTSKQRFVRSHSEIIAIFCRNGLELKTSRIAAPDSEQLSAAQWVSRLGLADNLDPYPQAAKMVHAVDGGYVAQFPVYPAGLPQLSFSGCKAQTVAVVIEDGNGLLFNGDMDLSPDSPTTITLPREIRAGYYGLLVRIQSYKPFESITFEGRGAPILCHMFPGEEQTSYYAIPDTTTFVQVTRTLWADQASLVEPVRLASRSDISALRALIQLETELEASQSSNAQLKTELEASQSSNAQLKTELEASQSSNAKLKTELAYLNQRSEVRLGAYIRKSFENTENQK